MESRFDMDSGVAGSAQLEYDTSNVNFIPDEVENEMALV